MRSSVPCEVEVCRWRDLLVRGMDRTGQDRILGVDLFCGFCYSTSPGLHRRFLSLFFPFCCLSMLFSGWIYCCRIPLYMYKEESWTEGPRGQAERDTVGVVISCWGCWEPRLLPALCFVVGFFEWIWHWHFQLHTPAEFGRMRVTGGHGIAVIIFFSSSSFFSAVTSLHFVSFPRCFFSRAIRTFTTSSTTLFLF